MLKKIDPFLFFAIVLHLIALSFIQFTAWPEMTFWPYLILKGWFPYRDIAIAHNPMMIADLSIFYSFLGVGLWQLKIYTFCLIAVLDIVLYMIVRELWNKKTALIALCFYIPLQIFYEGNGLWFDLYMTLPILFLFYFIYKQRYFEAGVFWMLAFLSKQTAVWFLFPIAISTLKGTTLQGLAGSLRSVRKFVLGCMIVSVLTLTIIWGLGILPDYIFWAYEFGVKTLPSSAGQIYYPSFRQFVIALFSFTILIFGLFMKNKKDILSVSVWALVGILGVIPRWELFHFQPGLPFLAIAASLIFIGVNKKLTVKYALVFYLLITSILIIRSLKVTWGKETRFYEKEVFSMSRYIDEQSVNGSKIYVLNAWDSIYVLSDTLPAVDPWVPHLSWYMELSGVQEEMVDDIRENKPELIVVKPFTDTGLSSYKPDKVVRYIEENYEDNTTVEGYRIFKLRK